MSFLSLKKVKFYIVSSVVLKAFVEEFVGESMQLRAVVDVFRVGLEELLAGRTTDLDEAP